MTNNFNNLPNSDSLNISALSRLFADTTNCYKYLYFISLLDILKRRQFDVVSPISFEEIIVEMLANTWYPHTYFKLSFGTQDQITKKLDSLNFEISEPIVKFTDTDKKLLREAIASQTLNDIISYFKKYVPYRLLCPFLEQELKAENISRGRGNDLDRAMPWVVNKYFQSKKPLYRFNSTEQSQCYSIIFNPEWAEYIEKNYPIVRGWASWEWLTYMQTKNPNITNIVNKLFIPQKRDSLEKQKKYWKTVLEYQDIECIYSHVKLDTNSKISLDHYLPWSFVAHDQLWNLIPTIPSINSSKSNIIPSSQYFNKFVQLQYLGLIISSQHLTRKLWLTQVESYIADLKIDGSDNLLDLEILTKAYENTIIPLISLAQIQGFSSDWVYSNSNIS